MSWSGTWRNERGSEMELALSDGSVTGTYRTAVGRPDASDAFRLTGFVRGELIGFTVDFGEFGSLTSWTGRLVATDAGAEIRTLWHLARSRDAADQPTEPWETIIAGASVFRRPG